MKFILLDSGRAGGVQLSDNRHIGVEGVGGLNQNRASWSGGLVLMIMTDLDPTTELVSDAASEWLLFFQACPARVGARGCCQLAFRLP